MIRRPPRSTLTDTLFPYTALFRSLRAEERAAVVDAEIRDYALLQRNWAFWARPEQLAPDGNWRTWLIVGIVPRPASGDGNRRVVQHRLRSEEHTSELQPLMRISYAVFCLKKQNKTKRKN